MTHKSAVALLILGIVLTGAVLFFLAVYTDLLIVLCVLLAVLLSAGVTIRLRPEVLNALRKPEGEDMYQAASGKRTADGKRADFTPHLILVSVDSAVCGQIVIDKPEFSLGRGKSCDYVFPPPCPEVGRVHMLIRYDPDERASFLIDNKSVNGTYVNQIRLKPGVPRRLSNGDMIQAGTLRFSAQAAHY
ncbi:MAG: FHA domain-containing protein [Oscillospiraceae bacterium]|nr:FHA domain-containing protein [Oscillospiraceae bacterium]